MNCSLVKALQKLAVNDSRKSIDYHVDSVLRPFTHSGKFATKWNQNSALFIFAFRFVREIHQFSAIEFQWTCLIELKAVKLWFEQSSKYKLRNENDLGTTNQTSHRQQFQSHFGSKTTTGSCLGFNLKYQQTLTTAGMVGS